MPHKDTHDWQPLDPGSPYYMCKCGVSGKKIGHAWPPIRDPKFVQPEFASCEKVRMHRTLAELKRLGVKPEDLES